MAVHFGRFKHVLLSHTRPSCLCLLVQHMRDGPCNSFHCLGHSTNVYDDGGGGGGIWLNLLTASPQLDRTALRGDRGSSIRRSYSRLCQTSHQSEVSRAWSSRLQTACHTFAVGLPLVQHSASIGERSIVMCVPVSACVCLSVRDHVFGTTGPILTKFSVLVTYGCGSVLLWQRNDMLCISGFMDDVIFALKLRLLDVAARLGQ